ncbi:bacteriorhodopsin [Spirosoma sp. KUDC1026]|uniref:bacteriorhodopsin n=1 Tax=Spirosoma sp. KUDC1026 TaxID=2745947 RepID=UPI00159BBA15|nr:bacteriorhodopsin [Spirosoma sp. KUDC1026]QKZ14214.1 bacteriorhodopsin [Spirosoma sp. KUDC1026]
MENMENLFSYSSVQHDIINHVLVLGVGATTTGLVYFILTMKESAPKYQLSSIISAVVMVSAALILFNQQQSWHQAFTWDGNKWNPSEATFSNGFRYVNWSIDVPMLLTQLLIVLGVSGAAFRRRWVGLVVAGLLMIYTGYVGQFYETTDISKLLIWGAISTVFMIYICYIVGISVAETNVNMSPKAAKRAKALFWLLIVAWTLYPIAYLVPWLSPTPNGMVARQILYTIADITSKVIYGIMLGQLATRLSAEEGYEPAREAMKSVIYGRD